MKRLSKAGSSRGGSKSKKGPSREDIKHLRRTAGLSVAISIIAATALLIIVNIIANKKVYSRDVETLGRYRLSEAAKHILQQINQPIHLTSIYTSTDPDKKPERYLPRLRDVMEEMARQKDNITIVNVTSDRQKAEVLARLRRKLDQAAVEHTKIIRDFQILAETQSKLYEQQARKWRMYPPTGWLAQFSLPKQIETSMNDSKEELQKTKRQFRRELYGSTLPNYPEMVNTVQDVLSRLKSRLERINEVLRSLSSLPEKARKARGELLSSARDVEKAISKAIEQIGKVNSPFPDDPSKVMEQFSANAREIALAADTMAGRLDQFVADNYARGVRSWRTSKGTIVQRYRRLSSQAASLAEQARGIRFAVKVELQKSAVNQLRKVMPELLAEAADIRKALDKFLQSLMKVDEPTKKIFEQAKKNHLQMIIKPLEELLERAGKVPDLANQEELIDRINQDNIVLVEVGDKIGVVSFDEVWPLKAGYEESEASSSTSPPPRVFYGDMAIASKLLSLSAKPFAEVVLTFFEDIPPRYFWSSRPPIFGPIVSLQLKTVREKLEKSNLIVKEWNIAKDDAPPKPEDGRKQVLIVLPPPEPYPPVPGQPKRPQWSPDEVDKVRKVIASGTPAIFLAGYFPPERWGQFSVPGYYGFSEYLRNDWAIDVKTSLRVVRAEPDPLNPGKYELPVLRWTFMPLSCFTDHPVGKCLKARRLYWYNVCPLVRNPHCKEKVEIKEIMTVPAGTKGIWATTHPDELVQRMYLGESSGITPNVDRGDELPPLILAAEAIKTVSVDKPVKENNKNATTKPTTARTIEARIIVLGVGNSYIDGFITTRVPRLAGGETLISEPPPTSDIDLLVNSVLHLIGKDEYIGAGPAIIQPIRDIAPSSMTTIKVLFGLAWPVMFLLIGLQVMFIRKR